MCCLVIPKITQSPLLTQYTCDKFPKALREINGGYLLVPLGKVVSEVTRELADYGENPCKALSFRISATLGDQRTQKKAVSGSEGRTVEGCAELQSLLLPEFVAHRLETPYINSKKITD